MSNDDGTIGDIGYPQHRLGPGPAEPMDNVSTDTQSAFLDVLNYTNHRRANQPDYLEGLNGEFPAVVLSAERVDPGVRLADSVWNWVAKFFGGEVPNETYIYKVYTVYTHGHYPWESYVDETSAQEQGSGKISWCVDALPDTEQLGGVVAAENAAYKVHDQVILAYQDQANLRRPYIKYKMPGTPLLHEEKRTEDSTRKYVYSREGYNQTSEKDCRANNQDCNNGHYVGEYANQAGYPKGAKSHAGAESGARRAAFFKKATSDIAKKHGVPVEGFIAQIHHESAGSWDPCKPALYKNTETGVLGDELGLAQWTVRSAKSNGLTVGETDADGKCKDERSNVNKSLNNAAAMLARNYKKIKNDPAFAGVKEEHRWALAAVGYNAGMGFAAKIVKDGRWETGNFGAPANYAEMATFGNKRSSPSGQGGGTGYGGSVPWKK